MPVSVQIGLLLSVATALCSVVGFLLKWRGAIDAPLVEWRRPIASSVALFQSRIYVIGILVAMGSWGLHVGALALAPISLVQAVIAGGLVFLTVIADRVFGLSVTRREWIGVALTAAGLAFLAATLDGGGDSAHSDYAAGTLVLYLGAATLAGALLVPYAGRAGHSEGPPLAVSAGLLWGASDIAIKALSGELGDRGLGVLLDPLALVILLLSLLGLLVSARSLQVGRAVAVIAVTATTANLVTILSGPVVFGEPLPDEPLALALRVIAFALVIFAAAMTPPPLPKEPAQPGAPGPATA